MGTLPNVVETSKIDHCNLARQPLRRKHVETSEDKDQTNQIQFSPATRRKKGVQQQHQGEDIGDESSEESHNESKKNSTEFHSAKKKGIDNSQSDSGINFPKFIAIPFAVGLAIVISLLLLAYNFSSTTTQSDEKPVMVYDKFEVMLKEFPDKFPLQEKDTWRKIRSAVKAVTMTKSPRSPGVITILGVKGAESLAHCMGRAIARSLHSAYSDTGYIHIRGADFKKKDSDDVKFEMDNKITDGLQSGNHVVFIEGLHDLPANSSLLFHGLCDNENAPFKESVFIFTSKLDKIALNEKDQEVTTMWQNVISEDQRSSLETRIGNNIVIAKFNDQMSFPQECTN